MYQFTANGEVIGYAAEPNYIKKLDNGCYGLCNEEEATGVSVNGTPYRLDGKELGIRNSYLGKKIVHIYLWEK